MAIAVGSGFVLPKMVEDVKSINSYQPRPDNLIDTVSTPFKIIDGQYLEGFTKFETEDDFVVHNSIHYDVALFVNNTKHFTKIIGVNSTSEFDNTFLDAIDQSVVNKFLEMPSSLNDASLLQHSVIGFGTSGTFTPAVEGDYNFVLFFFVNDSYKGYYKLNSLHVGPAISRLQAETNRDLQKEIRQTDLTNDMILEFTIIIVSAIPIGLGVEYRIERHIYELEKQDQNHFHD